MSGINGEKTVGGITIRQAVLEYKEGIEDFSAARLRHFEKMIIRAVEQLSIFSLNTVEVIYLTVGSNSTISLPNDYVKYTKIGVVDSFGTLWTLTLNENILRVPVLDCGLDLTTALRSQVRLPDNGYFYAPHFYNGNYVDTLYSVGGGFNVGYYSIDRQGGYLVISGLPEGTSVVMEYRSTGVRTDGKTIIPVEAKQAVYDWVTWQEARFRKNGLNSQEAKQDFLESERQVKNFQSKLSYDEWRDTIMSTYSQTVTRG